MWEFKTASDLRMSANAVLVRVLVLQYFFFLALEKNKTVSNQLFNSYPHGIKKEKKKKVLLETAVPQIAHWLKNEASLLYDRETLYLIQIVHERRANQSHDQRSEQHDEPKTERRKSSSDTSSKRSF